MSWLNYSINLDIVDLRTPVLKANFDFIFAYLVDFPLGDRIMDCCFQTI